jgi:hypothetical protein
MAKFTRDFHCGLAAPAAARYDPVLTKTFVGIGNGDNKKLKTGA